MPDYIHTTISNAPAGAVIETIHFGNPSGMYYKLAEFTAQKTRRFAWRRFKQGKTTLLASGRCRILADWPDEDNTW